MSYLSLSLTALIPAILLCWYIYEKDRVEKEPFKLLAALFALGILAFFAVIFAENYLVDFVDQMYAEQMEFSLSGVVTFLSASAEVGHHLLCGFFAIALLEEGVKWLVLYLTTRNNKNFDHLFDGIIFSVFVALGFAAMENVFYAVRDGWTTFLIRSLISVPSHLIFGVLMGYMYTIWHTYLVAGKLEKEYEGKGMIVVQKPYTSWQWLAASFILPVMLHGCYSFLRLYTSEFMTYVFYGFVLVLYILCFTGVRKMSLYDRKDSKAAFSLLADKYPQLKNE